MAFAELFIDSTYVHLFSQGKKTISSNKSHKMPELCNFVYLLWVIETLQKAELMMLSPTVLIEGVVLPSSGKKFYLVCEMKLVPVVGILKAIVPILDEGVSSFG